MKVFLDYMWHDGRGLLFAVLSAVAVLSLTLRFVHVKSPRYTRKRDSGWQGRLRKSLGLSRQSWSNLTYEDRVVVRDTWAACRSKNVRMVLSDTVSVPYPGGEIRVSGYFSGDESGSGPELCVAVGKPTGDWMTVLMHESSHMDQWVEQCREWRDGFIDGRDVYDTLDQWLEGKLELGSQELDDVIRRCVAIELDCEKRTLVKMAKGGMVWYTHDYVRKANAYIWSYYMVKVRRRWYSVPPYEVFEVWGPMPDRFMELEDYLHMSWERSVPFDAKCFGLVKREVQS
jgi:hypothetical protein